MRVSAFDHHRFQHPAFRARCVPCTYDPCGTRAARFCHREVIAEVRRCNTAAEYCSKECQTKTSASARGEGGTVLAARADDINNKLRACTLCRSAHLPLRSASSATEGKLRVLVYDPLPNR
jgi:hypothetical protein